MRRRSEHPVRPTSPAAAPRPGTVIRPREYRLATPLLCLGLLFAGWLAYAGACDKDMQFSDLDDGDYVVNNPQVQAGLTWDSIAWAFTQFHAGFWIPLTWLSLQLDHDLFGMEPWGYHLTNVLIHLANAVFLFLWLRWVTGAVWRSALVAGLFLLHPLHVESVAWVTERKDVLSTLLGIATLWAYAWYACKPSVKRYLLVAFAFALSMMAKPMLVTLPVALLLLDWWPLQRGNPKSEFRNPKQISNPNTETHAARVSDFGFRILEKLPLLVLAIAVGVLTVHGQQEGSALRSLQEVSLRDRLLNVLISYGRYIGKTLWPSGLSLFYPYPPDGVAWGEAIAAGALLILLTGLFLTPASRRRPYLAVGWLWFLGTLAPVSGVMQSGYQALADRFTYVPNIGLYILMVWGLTDLAERFRVPVVVRGVTAVAVLSACLLLTSQQTGYWRTPFDNWQHAADVAPDNYVAQMNVGNCLAAQGQLEAALPHYQAAVTIAPRFYSAQYSFGMLLQRLGRWDEAAQHLSAAAGIDPKTPKPHAGLAYGFLMQGRLAEAETSAKTALELSPHFPEAHNQLGMICALRGDARAAHEHFASALGNAPGDGTANYLLAWALHAQGATDQSQKQYELARSRAPNWPRSAAQVAWALATHHEASVRNGPLALLYAEAACQSASAPAADCLDALAASQAETGRFTEATGTIRRALRATPEPSNQRAELEKRLKLYESGRPFHADS